ncbi:P63C domain-containing protein [Candidatus Bipolaricaulota bacterium]|nr:P63C domain-containing protein [Candidatus Bipolaricaulota bacterium]
MSEEKTLPREEFTGIIEIGDRELPCSVLEDGTRVISARGINRTFGQTRTESTKAMKGGDRRLPAVLASDSLQPYLDQHFTAIVPIRYRPKHGGRSAFGYEASLLPKMCEAVLDANKDGVLHGRQRDLAMVADLLIRGFAQVGIIALIDEATGYQEIRAKRALAEILEKFIAKELQPWTRRFPEEFYQQIFRLREWQYDPTTVKRPSVIGKMTNDLIYERLAAGVLDELRRKNPVIDKGYRKHRHHQWFTDDIGHPRLREHLHAVIALMKASSTWNQFKRSIERAFPRLGDTIPLPLDD